VLSDSSHAIVRGPGGWLQHRRTRFALWVAALEGVIVAFSHDVTKWTVIVLAIVGTVGWLGARESKSNLVRQIVWIFAAAQLLAVILVILAWVLKWALILGIVVAAVVGLGYLFLDRR
jgi:hypothetical protein